MRRCGFRLSLACSVLLSSDGVFRTALHAETRTAASLTPEAVWEAIDAAGDGDTVELPAGTAVWTKFLAPAEPGTEPEAPIRS